VQAGTYMTSQQPWTLRPWENAVERASFFPHHSTFHLGELLVPLPRYRRLRDRTTTSSKLLLSCLADGTLISTPRLNQPISINQHVRLERAFQDQRSGMSTSSLLLSTYPAISLSYYIWPTGGIPSPFSLLPSPFPFPFSLPLPLLPSPSPSPFPFPAPPLPLPPRHAA